MGDRIVERAVTRRELLAGLGTVAAAGLLAGCGLGSGPSATQGQPSGASPGGPPPTAGTSAATAAPAVAKGKRRVVYSNYEQKTTGMTQGLSDYWDMVKAEFEKKYPDVEVVQQSVPSSEYWNKLFTEISTGNAADVYKDKVAEVIQYTRMGLLSPLDDYCNVKEINVSFESVQQTQIIDGKTYGVAYQGGSHQLVYNKNLLEKGGFKVPTTPEEAYQTAKALTKPGEQWGFVVVTVSVPQLYTDLTQWVVGYDSHWGDKGKATASADGTVAAMEMYKRIVDEGLTPVGIPKPQTREMFVAGKIAMMIEGPWFFADPKITPDKMAWMGTSTLPWANKRSVGSASSFIIPKAAKNKEDAGKFIEFACSQEMQAKFVEVGFIPGNRKGSVPKSFVDTHAFMPAYIEGAPKAVDACPPGLETIYNQVQKDVIDSSGEFLFKNVPVKTALANLQAQLEKELAASKPA